MSKKSLIPSFEELELHAVDEIAGNRISKLSKEIKQFKNLANPNLCEAKYLPYLAYSYKADFWNKDLKESIKRNLIQSSLMLHIKKGTIFALKEVFKALNIELITIQEYKEYNGEPYHFKLVLESLDTSYTKKQLNDLEKYVSIYKNVKSVLDKITIKLKSEAHIKIGSTILSGEITTINPKPLEDITKKYKTYLASTIHSVETCILKPKVNQD